MKRAKKVVLGTLAATTVLVGAVGALHLPFARPLLMRLGGCPADRVSPLAIHAARHEAITAARGPIAAPARPALGFALDEATIDDVRAWSSRAGVTCDEKREGTFVRCRDVAAASLPGTWPHGTLAEVTFGLSPKTKKVIAVATLRSGLSDSDGVQTISGTSRELEAKLGAPTKSAGDASALASAGYHTATLSYAYSDYLASVTATKMPERGVLVREEYLSARD
jgi:hypothetical protein